MFYLPRPAWALLLLAILSASASAVTVAPDTVARVNDSLISRKALNDVIEGTLALEKHEPDSATTRRMRVAALDSLIGFELLYQASIAGNVTVSDAEVEEELARTKTRFPDDKSFSEALARKGMTTDDLRSETRRSMAVTRYLERNVWRDINVTPEQVGDFYRAHRDEFRRPAEVRASHILVRVEAGASDEVRKRAWAKAVDLLDKLNNGADFARLARQYSQDPATAERGGDLGFFSSGTMVEAFEKPVFALAPGQLTGVFETPYGFHIAKVTDRRLAGAQSLDEVRDTIREHITRRERQDRQAKHVESLRQKASVEIYDPELDSSAAR